LVVFGERRHPAYPDVPFTSELGFPYMPPGLNGMYAPKNTPEPIVARLENACAQAVKSEKFRQVAATLYQPVVYLTGREFAEQARLDYAFKADVIKAGKISVD
jgi:tripartite-type tricarboxylate transporter receptor subunit TctC